MALSCECDTDPNDLYWWWGGHSKLKQMPDLPRRKRCNSCHTLINPGEDIFEFRRFRHPKDDIEYAIHYQSVPLASYWTCEVCSGLIMAVEDLGMCYSLGNTSIKQQIKEYREAERDYQKYRTATQEEEQ